MSSEDFDDDTYKIIAAIFQVLVIAVEPWVIVQLWRWFVVPLDVRPIVWSQAFGLNLLIGLIVYRWIPTRTPKDSATAGAVTFGAGLFCLVVGWFVYKLAA